MGIHDTHHKKVMMMPDGYKKIELLDTTLRDGSYAVDFQFTRKDAAMIAFGLEKLGFRWIEIGHGLGLNASPSGKGSAASTDREYLAAVSSVLKKARFGTFFIPGIGRKRDLDVAKEYRMDFVRIGTNANEIDKARDYIRHSKKLGFIVSANLMKSYVLSPAELYENSLKAAGWGADIICLVDSAGCMLPDGVKEYFEKLAKISGVALGFHGHNNLGLAVANTLAAIDCGATIVDGSLEGLGRSAGNAPSEILVAILKNKGMLGNDIDLYNTLEFSHKIISPMLHKTGIDPISVISGYAGFHSAFTKIINKYAAMYQVDPKELIVDLCAVDQVKASEKTVKNLALRLYQKKLSITSHKVEPSGRMLKIKSAGPKTTAGLARNMDYLCGQLNAFSRKFNKMSVINVVTGGKKRLSISRFIRESPYFIIGTVELNNKHLLEKAMRLIDGKVDYVLMDCETKMIDNVLKMARKGLKRSKLLVYKDNDSWTSSIYNQLVYLLPKASGKIAIFALNNLAVKLAISLSETGFDVVIASHMANAEKARNFISLLNLYLTPASRPITFEPDRGKASCDADALVGLSAGEEVITRALVKRMKKGGIVVDGSLGSVTEEAAKTADSLGIKAVRVDMGPAIASEVACGIGVRGLVEDRMGKTKIGGISCIAGGLFGKKGDIVLDSARNPNVIAGVADGRGSVIFDRLTRKDRRRIEKVEGDIALSKIR